MVVPLMMSGSSPKHTDDKTAEVFSLPAGAKLIATSWPNPIRSHWYYLTVGALLWCYNWTAALVHNLAAGIEKHCYAIVSML